ncbi:hypothetical protein [Lactobacillus johnsonii]|uniref:hypothetical protein n=1 Tax=Lactobacillus johnsonii TaxID=33959 RepID=UPI001FB31C56|nr:hypothetical protein [Lactobacillus johnsonii]UOC05515.1 hypothetical protein LC811_06685 [Lactobacillus johnsonii]
MERKKLIKRRFICGILMVIASGIFLLQALAVTGIYSSISDDAAGQGFLGIITSGYGLGLGIFYIVTRNRQPVKKRETILDIIVIVLAILTSFSASAAYSDLSLCGWVIAVLNVIAMPWGKGYKEYPWNATDEKSEKKGVSSSASTESPDDPTAKLTQLKDMYEKNLISKEDYENKKSALLDQIVK